MSPLIFAGAFILVSLAFIYGVKKFYERRLESSVKRVLAANEHVLFETGVSRGWPSRLPLFNTFGGTCTVTDFRLILAGGVDWGHITVESIPHSEILDVLLKSSFYMTTVHIATQKRSIELLPDWRPFSSGWEAGNLADALNQARSR